MNQPAKRLCRSSGLWLACLLAACVAAEERDSMRAVDALAAPPSTHAEGSEPAAAAASEASAVARLIALGQSDNRVQDHLRHLSLAIGPRLTGSHGLMQAEEWCRDQFASFGLDSRLERWGEFAVGFDRGARSGGMVVPEEIEFVFTTPAWTPGTKGAVRGPALLYPEDEAALEALRPKLAGAWVVRRPSAQGGRGQGGAGGGREAREWRLEVDAALIEAEAAGEISASRGEELVHTGGSPRIEWSDLPKKTSIVLRGDQHADLVERLEAGEAVELEFEIDNRFFEGPVPLHNVVADLRGAEKPDEYVIVCGHLDSWDGAQGTLDNGTGCATTLEAARLLAASGVQPKRTIRFILWSGEEQGLLGSAAYVEANKELLPKISAVFNHDEGTNYLSGLRVTPEMMPVMRQVCAPLEGLEAGKRFELGEQESLGGGGGSDHASFVRAGVPGFFWQQSGRSDYERHHHTQYDTFDAAIPDYQEHSALVAALVAFGVAEADQLLDRTNMAPIEPRRLGIQLDGTTVTELTEAGKAAAAQWQVGDEIVSIDGQAVESRRDLNRALQQGGAKKEIVLRRGEESITSVVDWSDDPGEKERARRAEERAQRQQP